MTFANDLRDLINKYSDNTDPQEILGALVNAYDPAAFNATLAANAEAAATQNPPADDTQTPPANDDQGQGEPQPVDADGNPILPPNAA